MFRKFLVSAIAMYTGCVLIGYNVAVWLGFAVAFICTAFFCIGWELILQGAKNTEQDNQPDIEREESKWEKNSFL